MAAANDLDTARPRIGVTAAQLFVTDIATSCDFFTARLGFEIVHLYGAPPFYARLRRDGGVVNLRRVDAPVIDPALRDRESLLSADFALDEPQALTKLYLELQAAEVRFFQGLRREPWGALTFIVGDPDGNLLLFAAPAAQPIIECVR